ncbi:MAG: hydrogenase expression/formation protein HypE [Gammaproteobacteria bacterium]|nr:hydrogenase expression/formation protein HypE [Gammaproteobacteria bacterium]
MSQRRPRHHLNLESGRIDMSHGSGGRAMAQLIDELFRHHLDNRYLRQGDDHASFEVGAGRLAMSTDGHVISPLFFPGGDIGSLAIHGTVNDVAMAGAMPHYLSAGFILEEGLPLADLQRIVISMAEAATAAGVAVITGDTKVVERGKGDGIFITTTGVGTIPDGVAISGRNARPGDRVIVSGTMGDHGVAILACRNGLQLQSTILSDSAPLHRMVAAMVAVAPNIHSLRDPTRGGLATTLNELAQQSQVGIRLEESAIPVREEVSAVCELLGLDPLYSANEGKLICICDPADAEPLVATMRRQPYGEDAAVIGEVVADPHHFVQLRTRFGGSRIVDWLVGEQLPRIC